MELFDSLEPKHRSAQIRESLAKLAAQNVTERGAVFTRPGVVEAILDLVGYTTDRPLHQLRLLEPAFGGGAFLDIALTRLLASFSRLGGGPERADALANAIVAVEIHPESHAEILARLCMRLQEWGCAASVAEHLCKRWLVLDDFLLHPESQPFDVVVGNPPYVRQERIEAALLVEYRRRYRTLYDRADLYVPFFERALGLLKPGGRLGFICSNRWVKNRYGGPLRELVSGQYSLRHYINLEGADAFEQDVIAYPAITVIERGGSHPARVAAVQDLSSNSLSRLVGALLNGGPKTDRRIHEVPASSLNADPWMLDEPAHQRILRGIEAKFPSIEAAGCKIGIGVATGADRIFIGPLNELDVEEERKLPLLMASDLVDSEIVWRGRGVLNPWEPDGRLADLEQYPRFARYVRTHQELLVQRHCSARNPGAWYRTIDRIWPELTSRPKLVIPDIKGEPTVVYDEGHYYPHHNLYWISSEVWDLRALATLLRSSVMVLFASAYSVKMAGGFLRYQAQVLRRVHIPHWSSLTPEQQSTLQGVPPTDQIEIDKISAAIFGLSPAEAATLSELSASTRVRKKRP